LTPTANRALVRARTARTVSSSMRRRFSAEPPYSSVQLFDCVHICRKICYSFPALPFLVLPSVTARSLLSFT
jgi:hypothetical protein